MSFRNFFTDLKKINNKYTILSISSTSAGYDSKREYSAGEKYANVAFYKEIYTVADYKYFDLEK